MQSMTRWCLNEASMSYGAYTFPLFPIGRVNLQGQNTKRQKSYASDLRQSGANWREARLRGSIVPRPPMPMLSERIGLFAPFDI